MSTGPRAPVTLAVVNARVWTGDPRRPWADAVVVRGAELAFVGSGAEARKLTRDAPDAQVIDARGQFLAPADAARTLRPGEPADFVLTEHDPTGAPPDATAATAPALVVRAGQVVDAR